MTKCRANIIRLHRGFSIVTAVFLVVVLALLGVFIVSVTGLQLSGQQLDVQGVRAYQAARAGVEWGAFQVLDPNNTLNAGSCTAPAPTMPVCPGAGGPPSVTNINTLAGSLSPFTVTIRCTLTTPDAANGNRSTTEGNRSIWAYQITADACNQPSGGSCPSAAPGQGYVSRQVTVVLSKCKDSTAAPPRCACG
jgi:MSHA biogenesis protein MshP